jgi:hypothetical protein
MTDHITEPADGGHHYGHTDHVDDEHPLNLIEVSADAGHDLRDGDVHDGRIEGEEK